MQDGFPSWTRPCVHFTATGRRMVSEVLFADVSPMDEILERDFTDNDCTSSWIQSNCLQELFSEKDDMENTLLQSPLSHFDGAESATSSEPQSLQSLQDFSQEITDDELTNLSIRDLNQRLKSLPKEEAQKIRRRRRSLKNRGYATSCRQRRTALKESLQTENQRLKDQIREAKDHLCKAVRDRDSYKTKFDQLNKVYATLNTPSFVMKHKQ
ncbi:uncharacterized protein LOC144652073 [Oculina patagonica]